MTLEVDLIRKNGAKIKLVHVSESAQNKFFYESKEDKWLIMSGDTFFISKDTYVFTIPLRPNTDNDEVTLYFYQSENRRLILKELCRSLLDWSNSINEKHSIKPHIIFIKNNWIIF